MQQIDRKILLSKLESLEAGLDTKDFIDQSSCFVFQDGWIHTFNDETACRIECDLKITGAIPHKKLLELLRKMKDKTIRIEQKKGKLCIAAVKKRSEIILEKEILLPINSIDKPDDKNWRNLPEDFSEAAELTRSCVGSDDSVYVLTCVRIAPKYMESTDSFQVCRWKIDTGVKEPILIRGQSLKSVAVMGMTEINESGTWVHFRNSTGLIMSCHRYVEEYPNLSHLFKGEGQEVKLPKSLGDTLSRTGLFSSDDANKDIVRVYLSPGKIKLMGRSVLGKHKEWKDLPEYDGPSMSFIVMSTMLEKIISKHSTCIVTDKTLKVKTDEYIYATRLVDPEQEQATEEGTETEGEE